MAILGANTAVVKAWGKDMLNAGWAATKRASASSVGRGAAAGAIAGFGASEANGGRHNFRDSVVGGALGAAGGRGYSYMKAPRQMGLFGMTETGGVLRNFMSGAQGDATRLGQLSSLGRKQAKSMYSAGKREAFSMAGKFNGAQHSFSFKA